MHPFSQLLISGEKSVETRDFPLPEQYIRTPIVLVQSKGPDTPADSLVAIGQIQFTRCFEYADRSQWLADYGRHCVEPDHAMFGFTPGEPKFGWNVEVLERWHDTVKVGDYTKTGYQSFLDLSLRDLPPRSTA